MRTVLFGRACPDKPPGPASNRLAVVSLMVRIMSFVFMGLVGPHSSSHCHAPEAEGDALPNKAEHSEL